MLYQLKYRQFMVTNPGDNRFKSRTKKMRKVALREQVKKVLTKRESQKSNSNDDYIICYDCKHNTISYEPSNEGTCSCGCHL
jgi:hypothetical protein